MAAAPSVFLVRALEKILHDKDTKRSQHAQLKKVCSEALNDVKKKAGKRRGKEEEDGKSSVSITAGGADAYFLPFELACKSRSPRIISTALDCMQKLLAPGHLTGSSPDPNNPKKLLVDRMVTTVCDCFQGVNTDEGVQLQIIKALLTMVSAPTCEVHEASLLLVVRTCYSIYLASKNLINQTTAKATLTQMLSIIFQRMEQQAEEKSGGNEASTLETSTPNVPTADLSTVDTRRPMSAVPSDVSVNDAAESDTASTVADSTSLAASDVGNALIPEVELDLPTNDELMEELSEEGAQGVETVARQIVNEIVLKVVKTVDGDAKDPTSGAHEEVTAAEPTGGPQIPSSRSSLELTAADVLSDTESTSDTLSNASGVKTRSPLRFQHILQKDAFLVFRSLCKLSMKALESQDPKSHELRSKVLSLELILSVLQSAGPVFQTNALFVNAIKQYLCVALSKNGVSSVAQVFELSLSIFLILLQTFKFHLKMQIEVFFKEIFLSILHSATSSYHHKWLVMQALGRICADAQCIVDIYLNYDCDLSLANIFERLISDIAHVAQGHRAIALGHPAPGQEKAIQLKGIECLVSILKCLVEWSRELYVHPGAASNSGTVGADTVEAAFPLAASSPAGVLAADRDLTPRDSPSPFHVVRPSSSTAAGEIAEEDELSTTRHGSIVGMDNPEQFEVLKKKKVLKQQGLRLFVEKPKKGIAFLQEQGFLGPSPEDVARFFHNEARIDPVAVGEYLGESAKYCIDVMYNYVDMLDFSGVEFVPALRLFLSGFRLPGESQKIDRLMEKFAARYCETNTKLDLFASADAAYVLAYSIIMLATDLHSTKIKRENKMTREQYIKMNRGINDQKDLPRAYLEKVYDEIAKQEITLRGGNNKLRSGAAAPVSSEKMRRYLYTQEMEAMAETAKAMMEDRSHIQTSFTSATHIDHVRPMFQMAWTPFLAALSLSLRDSDDMNMVTLCLEGFRCAIRVASVFDMALERNAFVQSLAKFTLLTHSGLSEMKPKNIETIKTLIAVAHSEGNYLQESWQEILNVVSQLELAQLIGTGVKTRFISSGAGSAGKESSKEGPSELLEGTRMKVDQKTLTSICESMGETSSQSVVVAVDRIFTSSSLLNANAIVDFVAALCNVSLVELDHKVAPRMFSLTKIVEISYYNMGRIRLEWSRIWAVLGDYFNKVGCNSNDDIAFFAMDSLRQLSMKFLEKGELANFRFQKDFLRPFEVTMKNNSSLVIRDMIVRCMAQMVSVQAHNIKSGWKNIFAVFHLAASDRDEKLVDLAFQTTTIILEKHFSSTVDSFQDAVKCLSEFACNPLFPDTSMEAIRLIDLCAKRLSEKPELFKDQAIEEEVEARDRVWVKGWFPVLFELSCIVSRCKLDVRTRALTVMFNIMKSFGHMFGVNWWHDLFNVVFRIFDNMKLPEQHKSEWMTTTCPHALMAIIDVFSQFFEKLAPVLLNDLFNQFCWCAQQDNKDLAGAGLDCLESFVMCNGRLFDETLWDKTIVCISRIYEDTLPLKLLTWRPEVIDSQGSKDVPPSPILIPRRPNDIQSSPSIMRSSTPSTHRTAQVTAPLIGNSVHAAASMPDIAPETKDLSAATDSPQGETLQASGTEGVTAPSPDDTLLAPEDVEGEPSSAGEDEKTFVEDMPIEEKSNTEQVETSDSAQPAQALEAGASDQTMKVEKPAASVKAPALPTKEVTSERRDRKGSNASSVESARSNRRDLRESTIRLFITLLVRCQVQRSLIFTIDHILFSAVSSKQEDLRIFMDAASQASQLPSTVPGSGAASATPSPKVTSAARLAGRRQESFEASGMPNDEAMLPQLNANQLLQLVDLLLRSHEFAKEFNTNEDQRTVLWKAGFMGKSKPNMWSQETQSVACVFRILFRIYSDDQYSKSWPDVEQKLISLWREVLTYYSSLTSEKQRLDWMPVLLLLFHHLHQLSPERFDRHLRDSGASVIYTIGRLDLRPEVRCALCRLLERIHFCWCNKSS